MVCADGFWCKIYVKCTNCFVHSINVIASSIMKGTPKAYFDHSFIIIYTAHNIHILNEL